MTTRTVSLLFVLAAAASSAATIAVQAGSTTLAGGEVITIGPASITFTPPSTPFYVWVPVTADTTIHGSETILGIEFNVPLTFAVDDGPAVSMLAPFIWRAKAGQFWLITNAASTKYLASNAITYPTGDYRLGLWWNSINGAAEGALGTIQTGGRSALVFSDAPEPGTFGLIGMALTAASIHVRRARRRRRARA